MSPSAEQQKLVDAYFRSHTAQWEDVYAEVSGEGAIYRERLLTVLRCVDELTVPLSDRVLEIGCGAGLIAVALAQRGYRVAAVDTLLEMLASARRHASSAGVNASISTSMGDAHQLAFPDGAFGLVLAIGLLPYLHSPEKALEEMARVLKPGGYLVVTAANRSRLAHILDPWLWPALQPTKRAVRTIVRRFRRTRPEPPGPSLRLDSLGEVQRWLSSVGLVKVKEKTVGFQPLTFHYRQMFGDPAAIAWNRCLQWLADHNVPGIKSRGMDYLIVASKKAD